ncbi:CidA/LrgA family protein [Aromatoleum toluvorans]|uniref:CidA/LrgA family protein n=1 Tax=Aromatoleum toluvorans TaxID=92002 RepID=A0ABX1PXX1_9RHOO|nr:CidA/LrgA family protein [Aromatoleum toluvorans]NMG44298.1 CidA/LrgA family protein [Aromatoleum toluvorans]
MIGGLTLLLVFQLVGEALVRGLSLPIPGPVIGMGLLFIALVLRGGPNEQLRGTATGILQHFSLLFVPAGTGVMLHFHRLADEWLPLTVALVASTLLSIAVSALLLQALSRHARHREDRP